MHLKTRLRSLAIRQFTSAEYAERRRARARASRERRGEPPTVHYFHQVDDPYSHLAAQKLDELRAAYDVDWQMHLVAQSGAEYQGSAEHFPRWARRDATNIAASYGVSFDPAVAAPAADAARATNAALAAYLATPDFCSRAIELGATLWRGETPPVAALAAGDDAVAAGNALRSKLGHYQGAMLHFDGEWYWGVDRLRLLELRLIDEGFGTFPLCVPEPTPTDTTGLDTSGIVLEYFPSLRSPYTAIGHRRVLELVARSGIDVRVRPVMPMLMRGIPAPRAKQRYIAIDAAREGRYHGSPMGRVVDPFGEPVRRAFALFPGAAELGRGMEFVTAYLQAAWVDGVDICGERGLRQVADAAGIEWNELCAAAAGVAWEASLSENLQDMFAEDLWGVPSFRVSGQHGGNDEITYACWGQDRIWRVEDEIAARA